MPGGPVTLPYQTDKKELGKTFLMYKEIQEGSGAMKKGFLVQGNAGVQSGRSAQISSANRKSVNLRSYQIICWGLMLCRDRLG